MSTATTPAKAPASLNPVAPPVTIPQWIDGQPTLGSGRASPVYNPSLGRVIREVNLADKAQVDRAVASGARAFPEWSQLTVLRRARVLFRFKELLDTHA